MAKRIMQFRYYDETNGNNQPSGINIDNLSSSTNSIFDGYKSITQLGI
jgi:hypothetical protein